MIHKETKSYIEMHRTINMIEKIRVKIVNLCVLSV